MQENKQTYMPHRQSRQEDVVHWQVGREEPRPGTWKDVGHTNTGRLTQGHTRNGRLLLVVAGHAKSLELPALLLPHAGESSIPPSCLGGGVV